MCPLLHVVEVIAGDVNKGLLQSLLGFWSVNRRVQTLNSFKMCISNYSQSQVLWPIKRGCDTAGSNFLGLNSDATFSSLTPGYFPKLSVPQFLVYNIQPWVDSGVMGSQT